MVFNDFWKRLLWTHTKLQQTKPISALNQPHTLSFFSHILSLSPLFGAAWWQQSVEWTLLCTNVFLLRLSRVLKQSHWNVVFNSEPLPSTWQILLKFKSPVELCPGFSQSARFSDKVGSRSNKTASNSPNQQLMANEVTRKPRARKSS